MRNYYTKHLQFPIFFMSLYSYITCEHKYIHPPKYWIWKENPIRFLFGLFISTIWNPKFQDSQSSVHSLLCSSSCSHLPYITTLTFFYCQQFHIFLAHCCKLWFSLKHVKFEVSSSLTVIRHLINIVVKCAFLLNKD